MSDTSITCTVSYKAMSMTVVLQCLVTSLVLIKNMFKQVPGVLYLTKLLPEQVYQLHVNIQSWVTQEFVKSQYFPQKNNMFSWNRIKSFDVPYSCIADGCNTKLIRLHCISVDGNNYVPMPESDNDAKTDVSLITGKLRTLGRVSQPESTSTSLVTRAEAMAVTTVNAENAGK